MNSEGTESLPKAILDGLRAGDAGALESCYELHGSGVYRICRGMLRQASDAEDATQEIFLKTLERAHQFKGHARFSTWLHRLTVNHCLHRLEKEQRRAGSSLDGGTGQLEALELTDGAPTPLEAAAFADDSERALALLARLPADSRSVLVLRELEGLPYAEIARILSIPEGTVMSRLARAREKLAALAASPPDDNQTCRTAS